MAYYNNPRRIGTCLFLEEQPVYSSYKAYVLEPGRYFGELPGIDLFKRCVDSMPPDPDIYPCYLL